MRMLRWLCLLLCFRCVFAEGDSTTNHKNDYKTQYKTQYKTWEVVGGDSDNLHYSSLEQINTGNVSQLRVAWKFDTGDSYSGSDMQCNPIVVDGVMYVTTPRLRVMALEASTGKQIWSFESSHMSRAPHPNRGLTYWTDGKQRRIFVTIRAELLALDAATGKLDPAFGTGGRVDLHAAFDPPLGETALTVTSPGVIYRDL